MEEKVSVITRPSPHNHQNIYSFLLSILFGALTVLAVYVLVKLDRLPEKIGVFDATIILLAVFRLTRLFVYDKIARFIRDPFVKREVVDDPVKGKIIKRTKYKDGPLRNISDLLSCPWCIGVWLSLFISFFFFVTPLAWFPIFVLAVAGFSTLIQIIINLIGWRAEQVKHLVEVESDEVSES